MNGPLNTFIRTEEGKHTLTVHYRTEAGEPGAITFSERGEPEGYRLELVSVEGRSIQEMLNVGMYFSVDGANGAEVMQVTNAEGVKVKDGVYVTHYISVRLPQEDAHRLSWQLHDFTHSAEHLLEGLSRLTPKIEGISYGGDYIVISYGRYRTLKLGLTSAHRFTLYEFGRGFDTDEDGSSCMTFSFRDEDGERHHVAFSAPAADVDLMDTELRTFLEPYRRGRLKAVK